MRNSWCGVKIRPRRNASGSLSFQVDYGLVNGRRKKVSFPTRVEAERALVSARDSQRRLGALGLTASPLEMAEFLAAKARLPEGISFSEVVEFFMREGVKVSVPRRLPEVVEDFVWSRIELGRDARTIQTYRHVLGALARAWPLRFAHELTREDVRVWLRGAGWSANTQNKAMGHLRGLFQWAISRKHAAKDPCEGMERLTVVSEEVEGLTVVECELLLRHGLTVPRFMPFLVLGLFRGMRRSELERLRWEDVNWEEGTVIAAAAKVKTRQRRVVEISAQMRAWIVAARWTVERMKTGPVTPANLKELWPGFWAKAGLTRWPHNGLRHTFASMHYAMHGDQAALQGILGQRSAEVLHTNYRALVTRLEAERFWAMMP